MILLGKGGVLITPEICLLVIAAPCLPCPPQGEHILWICCCWHECQILQTQRLEISLGQKGKLYLHTG